MNEPCSCGGSCGCGCCEGAEPLTPRTIVNRPGLDALAYRVGTHSEFLETMTARLSSTGFPSLAGLTTRDASDPSLALLDAWAVVADVLTFYQERIANEGYLRTATERRSVLELARLVGYAPRPGVAASTYLAYTLDPGPETLIPAGAASRSVPGPGELPQVFETMEDLTARAAWNNLQVRLTLPQSSLTVHEDGRFGVFLQGIATQVKVNDPLLILQNGIPLLCRAMAVEPDTLKDRTWVELWLWETVWTMGSGVNAVQESLPETPDVGEILARFSDLGRHGISPKKTTGRVIGHTEPLKKALQEGAEEAAIRAEIEKLLPTLRQEVATVERLGSRQLREWISGLIGELEAAVAPVPAESFELQAVNDPPRTTSLSNVLSSLAKPASQPPRGRAHLDSDRARLLAPGSDVTGKLLAAAQPELRDTLYTAWANTPVTLPPVFEVHALRKQPSVFGHNAQLKQIILSRVDGVDVRQEEWTLFKVGSTQDPFRIEVRFTRINGEQPAAAITLALGNPSEETQTLTAFGGQSLNLQFPVRKETVRVEVSDAQGVEMFPAHLRFTFQKRRFVIELDIDQQRQLNVSSQGSDPTAVTAHLFTDNEGEVVTVESAPEAARQFTEDPDVVWLDAAYPQIVPGGWIVLDRPSPLDPDVPETKVIIARIKMVSEQSRAEYGISAKSTRITLDRNWIRPEGDRFAVIRGTGVYAQSEKLPLAEVPISKPVCGGEIELAYLYDGLQPGRWLIVSGERTDVGQTNKEGKVEVPVPGVPAAELVMLADVEQGVRELEVEGRERGPLPGDRTHSTITLAKPLAYCYRRDTLKIYGNVARATHGETRFEVLGSGDAAKSLQSFTLKQPPLTYVSAPTPSGIESTLKVRVNDILWHEADSLAGLTPTDRAYIVRIDDGGQTTVVFGNGERGARLPTGPENVRANYRSGIGKPGNVKAGQISQLATRPLGVKDVINPLPATGGADRESRDQARRNAPLAVLALDRLVSIQDYEDFTRTFAGVGRAKAARLTDGRVELVHVTVAGEDDIPIGKDSELLENLEAALRRFGDPRQKLVLKTRTLLFLIVEAGVKVLPDYLWEKVEPKIRAAMLEAFGFHRRDLAQDALLSEAYRVIQGVPGVDFVDINLFNSVDEEKIEEEIAKAASSPPAKRLRALPASASRVDDQGEIRGAQLLYLSPGVSETLILKERKS